MTDAENDVPEKSAQKHSEVTVTLTNEMLNGLRTRVAFRTVGDVQELVADALNSYIHLGQLVAGGAQIYAKQGDNGAPVRLHFPFGSPDNV